MKTLIFAICLVTIIFVQADYNTPSLRGLQSAITVNKIECIHLCTNVGAKDDYQILIYTDVDVNHGQSGKIEVETNEGKISFDYAEETPINKKKLQWDTGTPKDNGLYTITKINDITPTVKEPNSFTFYPSLQSLSTSQETSQKIDYDDTTKPFSFKIKWDSDVKNYKLPVIAKKDAETVDLSSLCNSSNASPTDMICTLPKSTLKNGDWKISLKDSCYDQPDKITVTISNNSSLMIPLTKAFFIFVFVLIL